MKDCLPTSLPFSNRTRQRNRGQQKQYYFNYILRLIVLPDLQLTVTRLVRLLGTLSDRMSHQELALSNEEPGLGGAAPEGPLRPNI